MGNALTSAPPKWYWAASGLALVWNILGIVAFIGQMTLDPASLPPAEMAFYEGTPIWATVAFAVAVFGGTLGCIGLLLRQSWAGLMLAVCLLGIIVQISHSIFVGGGIDVFGPAGLILPTLTLTIGIALVWLAKFAAGRGWL